MAKLDALWEIAQYLTETDVAYEYAGWHYCIFCREKQYRDGTQYKTYPIGEEEEKKEKLYIEDLICYFPHAEDCIVLKLRELVKDRIEHG